MRRLILFMLLGSLLAGPGAWAQETADTGTGGPLADGERLFEVRCTGMCHQTPKADHLTAKQWEVVLQTMQARMKQFGMKPLTEREFGLVLEYLSAKAKE
jgi:hypothetical protein